MQLQNSVKLVIWDLDDTFWRGTLSEGNVERIDSNILIVKALIDRGIMCSVVSKNDPLKASQVLRDWGLNILNHLSAPSLSEDSNIFKLAFSN